MAKEAKKKTVYIFRYLKNNKIETWGFISPEEKKRSTLSIALVIVNKREIQELITDTDYNLCFDPNKLPPEIYDQYPEIKPLAIKDQEWLWRLAAEARAERLTGPIYIFQAGEEDTTLVLIIWHQEVGELFSDILDGGWMVMGFYGEISVETLLKKNEIIFTPPSDLPPGYINPKPLEEKYQSLFLQPQEQCC